MNLDIEKIKAALSMFAYSPKTASERPQLYAERMACEALDALKTYDPDANNKRIENPEATPEWYPAIDPITGDELFMVIEHPTKGWVPTYGGPFDSYTLAERDESESDKDHIAFTRERYDHDLGGWIENEIEQTDQILISEDTYNAYDPNAIRREVTFTFPWVYDNGDGQVYEGFTGKRENCHPIKLEGETLRMLVYEVNQFYKIKQQYLFELSKRPNSFHPNQYHGHAHTVDGIWDSDNGLLSGCKCAACMLHNAAIMSAGKE